MKASWIAVAAALLVVAGAFFLIGRSRPRRAEPPSPETGGPVPGAPSAAGSPGQKDKPGTSRETGHAASAAASQPATATIAVAPGTSSGVAKAIEAKVTVKKPQGTDWMMTDNPRNFRLPEPGKIAEMHRNAKGGDNRFATIYLYAFDAAPGSTGTEEIQRLERLDKSERPSAFKVLEERPVTIGSVNMTRRVTLWEAKGRETEFISVRGVAGGKLYVLMGFTEPRYIEALVQDFDAVASSLRFR